MIKRRGGIGRKDAGKQADAFLRLGLRAPSARTRDAWGNRYKVIDAGNGKIIVKARGVPPRREPPATGYWLIHGWWSAGEIYLDTELATWYEGDAVDLPDTDPVLSTWGWGLGALTTQVCWEAYALIAWEQTPGPILTGLKQALPEGAPTPVTDPAVGVATGLCILAKQAWSMAGRSLASVRPDGTFAMDWKRTFVQRDPDGGHWLFDAGTSLRAVKLGVPDSLYCLTALRGTLNEPLNLMIEAALLGYAVKPAVEDVVELIADLSPCYGTDGQVYTPRDLSGWHCLWQQGNDTAGAVRVGLRYDAEDDVWRSWESEITLSWSDGAWSAACAGADGGSFGQHIKVAVNGGFGVRVPGGDGLTYPLTPPGTPQTTVATVSVWTTPDGPVYAKSRPYVAARTVSGSAPSWGGVCGVGTWSARGGGFTTDSGGGWAIGGRSVEKEVRTVSSETYRMLSMESTGERSFLAEYNGYYREYKGDIRWITAPPICDGGPYFGNTPYYPSCSSQYEAGRCEEGQSEMQEDVWSASDGFGGATLTLLPGGGALALSAQRFGSGSKTHRLGGDKHVPYYQKPAIRAYIRDRYMNTPGVPGANCGTIEYTRGYTGRFSHGNNANDNSGGLFYDGPSGPRVYYRVGCWTGAWVTTTQSYAADGWDSAEGWLALPDGTDVAIDPRDWPSLLSTAPDSGGVPHPEVVATYGGRVSYTPTFGDWERPAGYTGSNFAPAIGAI